MACLRRVSVLPTATLGLGGLVGPDHLPIIKKKDKSLTGTFISRDFYFFIQNSLVKVLIFLF